MRERETWNKQHPNHSNQQEIQQEENLETLTIIYLSQNPNQKLKNQKERLKKTITMTKKY